MRPPGPTGRETLGEALDRLKHLSRHTLAERWVEHFGAPPPPRTSRALLIRAVAYKMQERVLGGLSASTRQRLTEEKASATVPARSVHPGTVLLREWQGTTHQVTVVDDGVLYRGERHRSLSHVARLITGSRWSGPRFFGLRR